MVSYFQSSPFVPIVNHCKNIEPAFGTKNNMHARTKLGWVGTNGRDDNLQAFLNPL